MSVSTEQVTNFLQENGDFKVYGEPANHYIFNGAKALNKLGYWHWIKCFDPNRGFIMSNNNYVTKLGSELSYDDHTGITFACTLRILQKISKIYIEGDGPNDTCSVCFSDEYCDNKTMLDCGHMFHENCVIDWFDSGSNKTCPTCRGDTLPNYDIRRKMDQ